MPYRTSLRSSADGYNAAFGLPPPTAFGEYQAAETLAGVDGSHAQGVVAGAPDLGDAGAGTGVKGRRKQGWPPSHGDKPGRN